MIRLLAFIFIFSCIHGFLLENGNPPNGQDKGYLTLSQFIDERDQLDHQVEQRFSVMSTQLTQKFRELEQKIIDNSSNNETMRIMEQAMEGLTRNYTLLLSQYEALKSDHEALKQTCSENVAQIKNETRRIQEKMADFQNLNSMKPLQEIRNLEQEVHQLSVATTAFSAKEKARTDDFLALYNQTLNIMRIQRSMKTMQNNYGKAIQNVTQYVSENDNLITNVHKRLNETTRNLETKISSVQKKVVDLQNTYNEKVSLYAIGSDSSSKISVSSGSVFKFSNIQRSLGITSAYLNNFKSSGKFVCEIDGLYLVASSINSYTDGSWFKIMKNNAEMSRTFIASYGGKSDWWHSSTGVTYVTLTRGDTISVQAEKTMSLFRQEATLTIVKIK